MEINSQWFADELALFVQSGAGVTFCQGFDGRLAVQIGFPRCYTTATGSGDSIKEAFDAAATQAREYITKDMVEGFALTGERRISGRKGRARVPPQAKADKNVG
jgi:hypothetical protein